MKTLTSLLLAFVAMSPMQAQTNAPALTDRTLQYVPDGRDFLCINGSNRYTRAIYGHQSQYRLETSDRPQFAIYNGGLSGNVSFSLLLDGKETPLTDCERCESRYTPGRRTYHLSDSHWGEGTITISALVGRDGENCSLWKIECNKMPAASRIISTFGGATHKRLSRNGDLGLVDPSRYDLPANAPDIKRDIAATCATLYYGVWEKAENGHSDILELISKKDGEMLFNKAEEARKAIADRIIFDTPDPFFNTLGGTILMAADGIWNGEVWLHGAVGWRTPLPGWRAAYAGDVLGWHDRARTHFTAYGNSMVTDVAPSRPQAVQDSAKNVARALEEWGTQMFSNGYICPLPNNNKKISHYDMNLRYLDELLQHLDWTGDLDYARTMWPKIKLSLQWQKRNFDPNDDGLYDAYANIWASDALYYNGGAVSFTSAFNYNANLKAARIARLLGEDATPFEREAEKIKTALYSTLWLKGKGVWAEYKDALGNGMIHDVPALWTIYNTIDQNIGNAFTNYQCSRWVDTSIPHIPLTSKGSLKDEQTVSTSNWFPYNWSTNNVAFAEVMQTALSYWQAGRKDEGYRLMKASVLDGMYLGASPGNIGQISHYDAARGEAYRDFGDPIGVAARAMIEGLYGIRPNALEGVVNIIPGFPSEWNEASITTPDISYSYKREGGKQTINVVNTLNSNLSLTVTLPVNRERIGKVTLNGKGANWTMCEESIDQPQITVICPANKEGKFNICVETEGDMITSVSTKEMEVRKGDKISFPSGQIFDPQEVLNTQGEIALSSGHHTLFLARRQGDARWWQAVNVHIADESHINYGTTLPQVGSDTKFLCVDLSKEFNANVTDIFQNEYLTPYAPQTTLRLPKTGIGDWCSYNVKVNIDDSGIRAHSEKGAITIECIPFATPREGQNIVYTSQWDNYPCDFTTPLSGKAHGVCLLLAGSTNQMQSQLTNGLVSVTYADGTADTLLLRNPDNWCPIEQDYYVDDHAFALSTPRPLRVALKNGIASHDLSSALHLSGINRTIEGGAATILYLPLDSSRRLKSLTLSTLCNDVVIGIMAATLVR